MKELIGLPEYSPILIPDGFDETKIKKAYEQNDLNNFLLKLTIQGTDKIVFIPKEIPEGEINQLMKYYSANNLTSSKPTPEPTPTPTPTDTSTQATPPSPTPTPTPKGTEEKKLYGPSSYTGVSIIDYLKSVGQPFDKEFRKKLAEEMKIQNYDFSASKNTELLNKLRSLPAPDDRKITTSSTGSPASATSSKKTTNDSKELLATDPQGKPTLFVRISFNNYRPAVKADQKAGVQLFARNPNPAARAVYPFIKVENMPTRRANL